MPLLSSACVEAPLVTTLKCWSGLPGHFRDHAQCRSCGLSSASVTSVGVVPWHRSLRLCCANPTARAISDMAVGPNPDSNPGLSDLRRLTNDIELGPVRAAGSNPGCANREVENFSDELEPGSNPGRANRRFSTTQKFANGPAVVRTGHLPDKTAAVQPLSRHDVVSEPAGDCEFHTSIDHIWSLRAVGHVSLSLEEV